MNPNDIEELLHQYGEDQRQQRQTVERLRLLARRQTRRRTALACIMAVLLGSSIATYRWMHLPESTVVLTAEQQTPKAIVTSEPTKVVEVEQSIHHSHNKATKRHPLTLHPSPIASSALEESVDTLLPAETPPSASEPLPNKETTDIQPTLVLPTLPFEADQEIAATSEQPPLLHSQPTNRLHFTASICASTVSDMTLGMSNEINLTSMEPSTNYTNISPNEGISANMGVAYTLAYSPRRHLDVGVGLSGYSQQNNLHIHQTDITASENTFMSDSYNSFSNITDEYYTFNSMSLYASVPLTLYLHPRGAEHVGWQVSIIPAHSLATLNSIGIQRKYTLNPWKLTVGVGVALPKSPIHRISLTANLLPLYPDYPLHEFGIELGI